MGIMGLFGFGKKGSDVIDLAEKFRKQKEREEQASSSASSETSSNPLAFFDSSSSSADSSGTDSEVIDLSDSATEKKRKLAKRILEITSKLEEISNQVYHLQQRIEVIEKKLNVRIE